jgi:hypothetical protein
MLLHRLKILEQETDGVHVNAYAMSRSPRGAESDTKGGPYTASGDGRPSLEFLH